MSDEAALPCFENVGTGRRAALTAPRGVDEGVIPPTTADVDADRGERGGGWRGVSADGKEAILWRSDGASEGGSAGGSEGVAEGSGSGEARVLAG